MEPLGSKLNRAEHKLYRRVIKYLHGDHLFNNLQLRIGNQRMGSTVIKSQYRKSVAVENMKIDVVTLLEP